MTGSKRHRFVEEKEFRPAIIRHRIAAAPFIFAGADDPSPRRPTFSQQCFGRWIVDDAPIADEQPSL
ncbi:hypothetical protein [Agrobacterium vitis]|uniref:hypothetical protein n=1 Tax=Agrobacterium vitis TaxID=373 RepID=UPI0018D2497F